MPSPITRVSDLVAGLGGPERVARWLGYGPATIEQWIAQGRIPNGHHLPLYLLAAHRRLDVALSVFGLPDGPEWLAA